MSAKGGETRLVTRAYATALVGALHARSKALTGIRHRPTKGVLRELLVDELFRHFLASQFGVGSGVIVNQDGLFSKQSDVIIYDKRVLPPFVKMGREDVFPWEGVLATIEVKSNLTRSEVLKSEENAIFLRDSVLGGNDLITSLVFGFYGTGARELTATESEGRQFLSDNLRAIRGLCLLGRFSWIHVDGAWARSLGDEETYRETKRFIALVLDNARTQAEARWRASGVAHQNWLASYIREE